jgi:selenide,water dikinase
LAHVLRRLPPVRDARILVDAATRDDAAVYRLDDDRALVATTDFFAPVVDDPAAWGRIAAANALSDCYAMGARPLFALSLVAWPRDTVPFSLLEEVIAGLGETAASAGCPIVGGHSIDSPTPHIGLAVIGEAHPDRLLTLGSARPGDQLVLTKPIGTGILTTALKRDLLTESDLGEAIRAMEILNRDAMEAALAAGVRAATDVTGFGLLGHLANMTAASRVGARLRAGDVPLLPHARALAERGVAPGGTGRNLDSLGQVRWGSSTTVTDRLLLADPQTSGGLLLAVPPGQVGQLAGDLTRVGTPAAALIGEITDSAGVILVERGA